MSRTELDRVEMMTRLAERRLTQRHAAELLGLTERQVRRLYRAFEAGRRGPGLGATRPTEPSSAADRDATPGAGTHPRALCGLRPDPGAREADRGARLGAVCRDGARLDDRGRHLAPAGPANAAKSPAARAPAVAGRAGADRRLRARVVRGPGPGLHVAGVRRRCHQQAHGAAVRRRNRRSTTSLRRGYLGGTGSRWPSTATGQRLSPVNPGARAARRGLAVRACADRR